MRSSRMPITGMSRPSTLTEIVEETPIKTVITVALGDASEVVVPTPLQDPRLEGAIRFADVLKEGAHLELSPVELTGDDLLFFQYTGGTTGPSKGAMLSHRNLVANIQQFTAHMREAVEPARKLS